jgi:hypothetical protein
VQSYTFILNFKEIFLGCLHRQAKSAAKHHDSHTQNGNMAAIITSSAISGLHSRFSNNNCD